MNAARDPEPMGPLIPLVGRGPAFAQLREDRLRALGGNVHFTLVTGETGVGKTRLIRSFLDATTSSRRCTVLKGQCFEQAPLTAYQPFVEVLRSALGAHERVLGEDERRSLFTACCRFLEGMCRAEPDEASANLLILYLEDLHLADRDSYDLLAFLVARLEGPIWFLAACHDDGLERDHPLSQIFRRCERSGMATRLEVERLEPADLEEIAGSLVGEAQAGELAAFLEEQSGGLPLTAAEVVNVLWDQGLLVASGIGGWHLSRPLAGLELPVENVRDLIRLRLRRLPNSTRRLATLAAVIGQSFDVQVLQEAADEHIQVVELGIEILQRRWLIRQVAQSFEFAHCEIRDAIQQEINPLRRQAMHGQVAAALEQLQGNRSCQALAYHWVAANEWEKALPHLLQAVEQALSVCAEDTAQRCCEQTVEVLTRLMASARNAGQAERWRGERCQFLERMQELRQASSGSLKVSAPRAVVP